MNKILNDYLEKINKYLKPMDASERVDIVKEIKSEMLELETKNDLSPEQIVERLGSPKELAKAYLGVSISKNNAFSWKKFSAVVAFYSLAGIGGMFVLPITSFLSFGLMSSGVIATISGIIKFIGFLIGFDVPFVMFQIGSFVAHPLLVLPLSIITGLLLFLAGKGLWKLTIKYIKTVSQTKRKLQNQ